MKTMKNKASTQKHKLGWLEVLQKNDTEGYN